MSFRGHNTIQASPSTAILNMTNTIQASPSAAILNMNNTIQTSPSAAILNMTNNTITRYIHNTVYNPNMTAEELNIAMGDPMDLKSLTRNQIIGICGFIIACSLGILIVYTLEKKGITQKLNLANLIDWMKTKYLQNKDNILPMYRPKKAKQSPFVSAMPMPQILPKCPQLEGAEKGNNVMFKLSVPYRRFQSSENLPEETEHRITITTTF
jgi:hypothetical protein